MKKIRICIALKNGVVMKGVAFRKDTLPVIEAHVAQLHEGIVKEKKTLTENENKVIRFKEFCFLLDQFSGAWVEEI